MRHKAPGFPESGPRGSRCCASGDLEGKLRPKPGPAARLGAALTPPHLQAEPTPTCAASLCTCARLNFVRNTYYFAVNIFKLPSPPSAPNNPLRAPHCGKGQGCPLCPCPSFKSPSSSRVLLHHPIPALGPEASHPLRPPCPVLFPQLLFQGRCDSRWGPHFSRRPSPSFLRSDEGVPGLTCPHRASPELPLPSAPGLRLPSKSHSPFQALRFQVRALMLHQRPREGLNADRGACPTVGPTGCLQASG